MLEQLVLTYAATFALAVARVGGFVAISPLPGAEAPAQARLGLVLVLAMVVTPMATLPGAPEIGVGLAIPAATEIGLGLLIGMAFRFVLAASDVLGGALSQAIGLGTPSLFNPALGAQDTAIGQVMGLFGMALALALGTHRVVISYLLESFRELPVGASLRLTASAPIFVELAGSAIAVGTRLAMPVIATAVALQVVLAMLARAAPSMQLFSVGFSVLILAGFATAIASLPGIGVGLASHFGEINTALDRLFVEIAPVR